MKRSIFRDSRGRFASPSSLKIDSRGRHRFSDGRFASKTAVTKAKAILGSQKRRSGAKVDYQVVNPETSEEYIQSLNLMYGREISGVVTLRFEIAIETPSEVARGYLRDLRDAGWTAYIRKIKPASQGQPRNKSNPPMGYMVKSATRQSDDLVGARIRGGEWKREWLKEWSTVFGYYEKRGKYEDVVENAIGYLPQDLKNEVHLVKIAK